MLPAGRVDVDLLREPLGNDLAGKPVFLKDIWPDAKEITDTVTAAVTPQMFARQYASVFAGTATWQALPVPSAAGRQTDSGMMATSR